MVRCDRVAFLALLALACGDDPRSAGSAQDPVATHDAADPSRAPEDAAVLEPADAGRPTTGSDAGGLVGSDAGGRAGSDAGTAGASGSAPPDEQPPPAVCATAHYEAETVTPEVMIVLDRSGSMVQSGRWLPSAAAIRDLTMQLQSEVRFGLTLFPAPATTPDLATCLTRPDPQACIDEITRSPCAPGVTVVPVALDNAATIATTLDAQMPAGATPTGETLLALLDTFAAPSSDPSAQPVAKIVLLITDGQPSCPAGAATGSPTQSDIDLANGAIEMLAARGVKTYVLGYQTAGPDNEMLASVLDGFAQRGGTGDVSHRSASDQAMLLAELRAATAFAAPCSIVLEEAPPRPELVVVRVDGVEVPASDPDGWMLVGDRTVQITGAACEMLAQGGAHSIDVDVHCE